MFCSVITKNSNWEILITNLVTFKRLDGVKDEKIQYYWGLPKNLTFKGGSQKLIYRRDCLKRGRGLGQFEDLRGAWQE